MKNMKRWLALVLTVCMVLSLAPASVLAASEEAKADTARNAVKTVMGDGVIATQTDAPANSNLKQNASQELLDTARDDDEKIHAIVVLEGKALLEQGFSKYEIASVDAQVSTAAAALQKQQDAVIARVEQAVRNCETPVSGTGEREAEEEQFTLLYQYNTLFNGFSAEIPYGALQEIRSVEGVAYAFEAPSYTVPEDMTSEDAELCTVSTRDSFGSSSVWNSKVYGYTGAGMRVAVIDTGLDLTHPSFQADPALAENSMTLSDVDEALKELNAYNIYRKKTSINPTADKFYRSAKVPFAFNYSDGTLDVSHNNDSQSDHGTHVSGIVAANQTEGTDVIGVAPDAQLLVMKVFGNNGSSMDGIAAAMEDSIRLNADVINMSLGSPAGFSVDEFGFYDKIMTVAEQSGVILAIAAGNSYSAAYGNGLGTDRNLASDPDIGTVSTPSTLIGGTSVASVENASIVANYIAVGDEKLGYIDNGAIQLTSLAGQTLEYVLIPDGGTAEAFAALAAKAGDGFLEGKVAVIQRGAIAFTDKQANARAYGAVAAVIYNNQPAHHPDGGMLSMADAGVLPNVGISLEDGEKLVAAAVENSNGLATGILTVADAGDTTVTSNPQSGTISMFSSWGVTPDLQLTPDVTAPGGNIYSTLNNGAYGMMSGTSMAAPHIAGMSALVLQFLREKHPEMQGETLHNIAEALVMSTAAPLLENGSVAYSPRRQGAGLANVYRAVSSDAYLTVQQKNGEITPKVSMGDNSEGNYAFTFDIHNIGDTPKTYMLWGMLSTDQVVTIDGVKYMGETSRALSGKVRFAVAANEGIHHDVNGDGAFNRQDVQYLLDGVNGLFALEEDIRTAFDLNGDGVLNTADVQLLYEQLDQTNVLITVAPGETATVSATVTLSEEDKRYMEDNYDNGCYVDGFVRCTALGEADVNLTLPLVGFYGDWSAARVFDSGYWYDADDVPFNRYWNVIFSDYGTGSVGLGVNLYAANNTQDPYDPSHNALSPDGDGYLDDISEIYLSLMRGAKSIQISWLDSNGKVLHEEETLLYARKSFYNAAYGICIPVQVVAEYLENGLWNLSGLKNNDQIVLKIEACLDDGDDVVDEALEFPIYIDTEAPELTGISAAVEENGRRTVTLKATDNHAIAAIVPVTQAGDALEYFFRKDLAEDGTLTIDVSNYDSCFRIAVCDYAGHETYYDVTFTGSSIRDDAFYAYRRYCVIQSDNMYYPTNAYNGWISFQQPEDMLDHTYQQTVGEASVDAAEYIDGYVIGVDVNSNLFVTRPGEWNRITLGKLEVDGTVYPALDMTFDYANSKLYVLTDNLANTDGDIVKDALLVEVDYLTGEVKRSVEITGLAESSAWWQTNQALTLACDNSGTLYTVDLYNGYFYTLDAASGIATQVGETGYIPAYNQSMTVDHETDTLYWAYYGGSFQQTAQLFTVEKATGACKSTGMMKNNAELSGLFKPYNTKETADLIPDSGIAVTSLLLSASSLTVTAGSSQQLKVSLLPYYATSDDGNLTWTSSDPAVAVVKDGVVTGTGEGTATITVSYKGHSATCTVTVVDLSGTLYVYDSNSAKSWLSMDAANPTAAKAVTGADTYETGISAAAYLGGSVYAYDFEGNFYKLSQDTLKGTRLGRSAGAQICAMTYDYTSNTMYALNYDTSGQTGATRLCKVNLANGSYERVENLTNYTGIAAVGGMTMDYEGNFYAIGTDAASFQGTKLVKFRLEWNDTYKFYDIVTVDSMDLPQGDGTGFGSLVYSNATNGLYWADAYGKLYWIDLTNYAQIDLGTVGATGGSDLMGLFLNPGDREPPRKVIDPTGASLDRETYSIMAGGTTQVAVSVEPWGATFDVTYETGDSQVATVDSTGLITAVAPGETTLKVTVDDLAPMTATIRVSESAGTLYGFMLYDYVALENLWVSVPTHAPKDAALLTAEPYPFSIQAGAYYDGYLYAVAQGGHDYRYEYRALRIDPMDYTCDVLPADINMTCRDMAFDYTTGAMYVTGDNGADTGVLAQMNLTTGELTVVGETDVVLTTLAITEDGRMYGVSANGTLYQVNRESLALTEVMNGPSSEVIQSMHYDLNSGKMFWAYASKYLSECYEVDIENGSLISLGTVSNDGAEISCLYTVPEHEPTVPASVKPAGVSMPETQYVVKGQTKQLEALVLPVSVANVDQSLTWTSSDPSVATVENGVVTGLTSGIVTVTATDRQGHSASCKITVLEKEREFWAFDDTNSQWMQFNPETGSTIQTVADSSEDKIAAAAYVNGILYAYSDTGAFYTIDTEHGFSRSEAMTGVTGQNLYGFPMEMTDLSYDASTGKLYGLAYGYTMDDWDFDGIPDEKWDICWAIGEIDLTNGAFKTIHITEEYAPGNLLVENGYAYFIDTYVSGIVTRVDLNSGSTKQLALIQGYWGMRADGRSMFRDDLTGKVYVIRGTGSEYDAQLNSTLYTLQLSTGAVREVCDFGSINVNSMFIK